jgi:hypothetical protein
VGRRRGRFRELFHCDIDITPCEMRIWLYGMAQISMLPQCKIATQQAMHRIEGEHMKEYVYEVTVRAVVRVRAADEETARKVVPTVLGAPGTVEIALANQNNQAVGRVATVTDVDFVQGKDARLLKSDAAPSEARASAA